MLAQQITNLEISERSKKGLPQSNKAWPLTTPGADQYLDDTGTSSLELSLHYSWFHLQQ